MSSSRRAIVIGAGITGTLVARELVLAGWQVVILEATHIGGGSSSRTAAGMRQQFSTPETVRGMRYSVAFYQAFGAEAPEAGPAIVQNGYLFLWGDEANWKAAQQRVILQHAAGLTEVEALSASEVCHRFPWVGPETCHGASWCPTDGFLRPEVVYQEAARRSRAAGVEIYQNAPVTGADHQGDRVVAVHTPKGTFAADLFIDCTNAWAPRLARVMGLGELPVDPIKRYLWFLRREGSMSAQTLMDMPLTICPSGVYCRPENPDTLLFGKKHDARAEPDFSFDDQDEVEPDFSHKTGIDAVPYERWMELAEFLPPLGEFGGIVATTCGYYGVTPDHNPFLDYDQARRNVIRLVGFSGHGAMFGPFSARVALTLAEHGGSIDSVDLDGERVSLAAFKIGRAYEHIEAMVI